MEKIAVAMSGGVDSSCAAWLLREQGDELLGVTLKLFDGGGAVNGESACCSLDDVEDARAVAGLLGIPHYVFNFSGCFREHVLQPFVRAYEGGVTPNPCIDCNRYVKFDALLLRAMELGCQAVATGHYARREYDAGAGRWLLKKALFGEKDQSYVLCFLTQSQLARSRFPLGELSKEEVRRIALERGFVNARKRESQDICFAPDGDYAAFIRRYTGKDYPEGEFVDRSGRVLGRHRGVIRYTLGQRRGLGLSSNRGRLYVQQIRPEDNRVVLGPEEELFCRTLTAGDLNLIALPGLDRALRLRAKIRYRQREQPCTVEQTGERTIRAVFDSPQRAITPGQAVVFYDGDLVVGGAVITGTEEGNP